ncbi:unnamed protein product [Staurois parvus]|uniref:Uncharacterized protein n=1 Tax=Staurois parvus TaxID=386267 RepID=A0ABN9H825_9NEOB|nr:unnamed protein product [Staurois parvus]
MCTWTHRKTLGRVQGLLKKTQKSSLNHCIKTLLDPDFTDPSLLLVSPSYLLIRHILWSHSAHSQFGVYY